jgi:hypothetical protein
MGGWLLMMPSNATSTEMRQQIDQRIGDDTRISSSVAVFETSMMTIQMYHKMAQVSKENT